MDNTAIGWTIDKTERLSKVGVVKLSESVRSYVFLLLDSQANAKTNIIGDSVESLSVFTKSFKDMFKQPTFTTNKIKRYQDILKLTFQLARVFTSSWVICS